MSVQNPIIMFLQERKITKLKKPGNKTPDEIESDFRIDKWVANASQRSVQLSLVSHPGKFSHPDAKITAILSDAQSRPDGYLRSGNLAVQNDVLGNAAALDVYAFLCILLNDQRTVLQHLEENSEMLRGLLGASPEQYEQWRTGLLQIKKPDDSQKTDAFVKQVYFPVADGYHLLSVLTASGIVSENRDRIREMKFSDATKTAREARKKNEPSEIGFNDLLGLLTVKYGGTQPQNISKLNSNNAGQAWLLPSLPPTLSQSHLKLPKRDFFESLRWDDELRAIFLGIHRIFTTDYNNLKIREARKRWYRSLFDWVLFRASLFQEHPPGWSQKAPVQIPIEQRLWLDQEYFEDRRLSDDWKDSIGQAFAQWSAVTYRKLRKTFSDDVNLGQIEETMFREEFKAYASELMEEI